ncbi:MAG: 4Fe-4S binding protein, partial [Gammaproteobacteria bacterium]|nr:4Fe-4S binding protein [Gammaproteobacteria bacterium]
HAIVDGFLDPLFPGGATMSPNHCVATLTRLSTDTAHQGTGVSYRSRGTLLIVCDGRFDASLLHEVGLPGPTVVVSTGPLSHEDVPGDMDMCHVQGRVTNLRGWLGEFSLDLAGASESDARGISPHGDGNFDMVIDLSASPLIERSVPPFGYFAPRDANELASALEECRNLVGGFAKPKYFHYELGLCAHASFGQPGCTRCLDVCGADAIRSEGDRINVEPHLCQGCAACTLACPTGALSFTGPTRESLLAQVEQAIGSAGSANPVLIVHPPAVQTPTVEAHECVGLAVEPLAAFGEELWLAALARGAGRVVLLADGRVPEETRTLIEARVEVARTMLDACGHGADAVSVVENLEDARALSSRGVVSNRREDVPLDSTEDSPLPAHHKRALLTRSLARLESADGFEPRTLAAGSPLGTIVVDQERCTLCSACAKICPTAAIRYTDTTESGLAQLAFAEELCVQCGACGSGCPENAISLQPRIASLPVRGFWQVVSSDPLANCLDCGRGFMPSKLLDANIRQTQAAGMPPAAVEQMKRCPDCRHRRINEG